MYRRKYVLLKTGSDEFEHVGTTASNACSHAYRTELPIDQMLFAEFTTHRVLKDKEKSRDQECEELRVKCEADMTEFNKNPTVVALSEKIVTLQGEFASLEDEKAKLEFVKASLRQDLENAKLDKAEVVSKVVPYVATELEVAKMKEPFDITKVKGYRPSYKQEHTKAGNDLATATFPYLTKFVADPYAPIEVLLSKKPRILQHSALTMTHVPTSSSHSQKATPSPPLMSPPPHITPLLLFL
ncbi:hypothetical protein Tco_1363616 [Tanacetum coccineum]